MGAWGPGRARKGPADAEAVGGRFVEGCDSSHVRCGSQPTVYHLSRITSFRVGHIPRSIRGDRQIKPGLVPPADRRRPAQPHDASHAVRRSRSPQRRPSPFEVGAATAALDPHELSHVECGGQENLWSRDVETCEKGCVGDGCAPMSADWDVRVPFATRGASAEAAPCQVARWAGGVRMAGGRRSPSVLAIDSPSSKDG